MKITRLLMAAGLTAALFSAPALAEERISIGTGGTGGLFYIIGAGMADIINKHMDGATARAEVTGASVENIRRVAAGQMTIGLSSSSTLYEASVGEGLFKEKLPVSAMAYLYPAVLQIAALEDSGIKTMADLAGKRINLGPPGSNSAVLGQRLLEAEGVFDAGKAQFLSYNEGTDALINGRVDAAVILAGAPTAAFIDLSTQQNMHLLSVDKDKVEGMIRKYPFYQLFDIPANTYKGQSETVVAINDPATLFTIDSVPADTVYGITKAIFQNLDELHGIHPQAKAITLETATRTPIALHPGARRFFDEAGVK
jgi:TRAP transporter TAXI family solute receptor